MCLSPHTCLSNKSCGNVTGSIHTVLLNVYGNYLTLQRGGNHLEIIKLQLSYQIQYSVHFRTSFFFFIGDGCLSVAHWILIVMHLILLLFLEFCYYSNSLFCSLLLCLYLSVCLSTYLPICVFINHLTTLLRKELKIYFLFTNIQKTLLKWERDASSCPKGQHTLAVLTDLTLKYHRLP